MIKQKKMQKKKKMEKFIVCYDYREEEKKCVEIVTQTPKQ